MLSHDFNGILVIHKPQNMTSHDVVAILRKKLKMKKIGHTGTLDPMATGVLPVCIGRATKVVDFLTDGRKGYACKMKLGSSTDTQDQWGTTCKTGSLDHISETTIIDVINSFVGEIDQIPPMYSAVKVGGQKLVDLARQGIEIKRQPRKRIIYSIESIGLDGAYVSFDVFCSKGTYIRTLCNDIGEKLGCYAHMTELKRIYSEPFEIADASSLEHISIETIDQYLKPIDAAVSWMPKLILPDTEDMVQKISNGVKLDLTSYSSSDAVYQRCYIGDSFYGIAMKTHNKLVMKKLIIG
ncbi:tRNA pseudouridine(55) synthase TruB [Fusibacter tunisiensis]|uniref:tRNA pseudouridine synthase B n=1 Tax=Fusibacter tunisiensis TaxID=1008308 RepID=A0ABS2MMK4_9FIRM|nr:tRNA pseudouridine(55) synthase TruB [Fusibacter tunisiensis]MBM7560632.1 tRNA pseudouridine55 synthase [Fusibacter tunisiensis]